MYQSNVKNKAFLSALWKIKHYYSFFICLFLIYCQFCVSVCVFGRSGHIHVGFIPLLLFHRPSTQNASAGHLSPVFSRWSLLSHWGGCGTAGGFRSCITAQWLWTRCVFVSAKLCVLWTAGRTICDSALWLLRLQRNPADPVQCSGDTLHWMGVWWATVEKPSYESVEGFHRLL